MDPQDDSTNSAIKTQIPIDIVEKLNALLIENKTDKCLEELNSFFSKKNNRRKLNEVVILQRKLHKGKEDFRRGVITREIFETEENKVMHLILEIIS